MSPYLSEKTPSSVLLFCSPILIFMYSVMQSVMYCSCSSLGMRSINGLTAFMVSDIKKHKHISKRISCHIACLMAVPGHSYVAVGVTEWYSVCFACRKSCGQISSRAFYDYYFVCVFHTCYNLTYCSSQTFSLDAFAQLAQPSVFGHTCLPVDGFLWNILETYMELWR